MVDDEWRFSREWGRRVVGGDGAQGQRRPVDGLASEGGDRRGRGRRRGSCSGSFASHHRRRARRRRRRGSPDAGAVERAHLVPLRVQQQAPRVLPALLVAAQVEQRADFEALAKDRDVALGAARGAGGAEEPPGGYEGPAAGAGGGGDGRGKVAGVLDRGELREEEVRGLLLLLLLLLLLVGRRRQRRRKRSRLNGRRRRRRSDPRLSSSPY